MTAKELIKMLAASTDGQWSMQTRGDGSVFLKLSVPWIMEDPVRLFVLPADWNDKWEAYQKANDVADAEDWVCNFRV